MKVKVWLKENKIYFETILAIVLAATSAALWYQSISIQETQRDIQKREMLPQFIVSSGISTTTDGNLKEVVRIVNEGRAANSFSASLISEFEFNSSWKNVRNPIILPVEDYVKAPVFSTTTSDFADPDAKFVREIESESGAFDKVQALQFGFKDAAVKKNLNEAMLGFQSYLLLTYQDLFGERREELYLIARDFSYLIVAKDKRREILDRHWSSYKNTVSIDDDISTMIDKALVEKNRSMWDKLKEALERKRTQKKQERYFYEMTGCTYENYFQCHPSPPE